MPRPRIPDFHAVPVWSRANGWTPLRQAEFIGELAETRNVAEAARRLGLTRETAYRLRKRALSNSFVAAWDAALERPFDWPDRGLTKVSLHELRWRVETGLWRVILRRGKYRGVLHMSDNSALLALVRRSGVRSLRGRKGAASTTDEWF
jgi:hypothetical protein